MSFRKPPFIDRIPGETTVLGGHKETEYFRLSRGTTSRGERCECLTHAWDGEVLADEPLQSYKLGKQQKNPVKSFRDQRKREVLPPENNNANYYSLAFLSLPPGCGCPKGGVHAPLFYISALLE